MPKPRTDIPFYGNHNNSSCAQCVYRMGLSYLMPDRHWTKEDMDDLCGAVEGLGTWPFKPVIDLSAMGLDVVFHTTFDVRKFLESPDDYMRQQWGDEGYQYAVEKSDVPVALKQAQVYVECLQAGQFHETNTFFTPAIMRRLLDQDYLLGVWVNDRRLNKMEGFSGHFILVYDHDETGFFAHDPGSNFPDGQPVYQYQARHIADLDLISAASPKTFGETDDLVAFRIPRERN